MKSSTIKAVSFILFGFVIGGETYKYLFFSDVEESISMFEKDLTSEAFLYLHLASLIRNGENQDALVFAEKRLSGLISTFTNKGRFMKNLNEQELKVIEETNKYWLEQCKMDCLPTIEHIFSE